VASSPSSPRAGRRTRTPPARSASCFDFSGTSGDLGGNRRLPSNWIADWRRLCDFKPVRADLAGPNGFNTARTIDTLLVTTLNALPPRAFDGTDADGTMEANLAFRNLTRAGMVKLASGQQMAKFRRDKGVQVATRGTPAGAPGWGRTTAPSGWSTCFCSPSNERRTCWRPLGD
jgi:hypothetical protein